MQSSPIASGPITSIALQLRHAVTRWVIYWDRPSGTVIFRKCNHGLATRFPYLHRTSEILVVKRGDHTVKRNAGSSPKIDSCRNERCILNRHCVLPGDVYATPNKKRDQRVLVPRGDRENLRGRFVRLPLLANTS